MSTAASNVVASNRSEPYYQPLVIVLAAAVAGILLDRFRPLPIWASWTLAITAWLLWLTLIIWRRKGNASFAMLLLAIAATGGAWHHCCWYLFADDDLGRFAGDKPRPVCVDVMALSTPRAVPQPVPNPLQMTQVGECWRFNAEPVALRNGDTWQSVSGRTTVLVQGSPPNIAVGDRVRCFVQLSAPSHPTNPGQHDRAAFMRTNRVLCRLQAESPDCLTVIEQGSPWNLSLWLGWLRAQGDRTLGQYLAPRQAELASAVLLGLREELDGSRNVAFLTTGTVHILSISGLHVSILAVALFWIMRFLPLPRGLGLAIVAAVTLLYTMMVDVEPPVVRSTVIVLVACIAQYLGQRQLGMNVLAAAALVVLVLNPAHLFNVGAQLSFLCVAGLIWIASRRPDADEEADKVQETLDRLVTRNLRWWERWFGGVKRATIGATLAGIVLWFLTLPLVMARFHILSPVALVLNMLLWPFMSMSVLSGFGVLVFGPICWPLGCVFGWICDVSFSILEWSVGVAQRAPGSHFWLPGPPDWWLWGFYGGLGLLLAFPRLQRKRRWCAVSLAAWIAVGLAPVLWPHDRGRLDCTFLDMGHGCAILVELPSGRRVLYDAGQLGAPESGVRTISECLWERNIARLDAVVFSHPDTDHYNALPGLLDKFWVGQVIVSPVMFAKDNRALHVLRDALEEHGEPVCEAHAGDRFFEEDGCAIEVLHPPLQPVEGHENASSLVLAVDYRDQRILLPGDLESPGLEVLLAGKSQPCAVLMAPHHGSRKSNSPELATWCSPRNVIFSGDGRWSLPEIEAPYRAAGGHVFHTHVGGAIHVQIDAEGVRVCPFAGPPSTHSCCPGQSVIE